nr:cholinesterase-like [Ciona intestinalis]|eukprot:XP_002123690.1 cholinesterase-like [Ciona intestinalis]
MGLDKKYIIPLVSTLCVIAIVLPIVLVVPQQASDQGVEDAFVDKIEASVNQGVLVGQLTPEAGMFLGIPFSQPPVADWRWRNPRDPVNFPGGQWDATYTRPACPQICDQPASEYSCPHETNEDCLYLNVWVPRRLATKVSGNSVIEDNHYMLDTQSGQSLAVMVWFYGGNFLNGAGSCVLYDGRFMSNLGDVIIVTTNYR